MPVVRAGIGAVAGHLKESDLPPRLDPDGMTIFLGDDTADIGSPREGAQHAEANTSHSFEPANRTNSNLFMYMNNSNGQPQPTSPGNNNPAVVSYVTSWQLDVAETYILDACKGRPPHVRMQHKDHFLCFKTWTPLKVYDLIHHKHWRWLMSFMISVQLLLGFFEHNQDYRPYCSIIEIIVLVVSCFDAILRLFCHDSQPTSQIHAICQGSDGVLLDNNGKPLGGISPEQVAISPSTLDTHHDKNIPSTSLAYKGTQDTPVLRGLPSFNPIKQQQNQQRGGGGLSTLSLNTSPKKPVSDVNLHNDTNKGSSHLSFQQFYDNNAALRTAMATNPEIFKHLDSISTTANIIQQRQLPTIEAPTSRFSKSTSPYLQKLARYVSWSRLRLFFITITFVDIALTFLFNAQFSKFYRITRLIRPFFFLEKGRVLRQLAKAVARTIPAVLEVVVLITLTITTFSIAGFFLYSEKGLRIGDNPFFSTIENSMFSMTVLMTTANFPDVMMASYSVSNASALFFCAFLIVALYLLFNVILSAVYSRFQYEAYRLLHTIPLTQLYALTAAFELLARPPGTPILPPDLIPHLDLNDPTHSSRYGRNAQSSRNPTSNSTNTTTTTTGHDIDSYGNDFPPIIPSQSDVTGINSPNNSTTINSGESSAPIPLGNNNNVNTQSTTHEVDPLLRSSPPSGSYGATASAIPLHSLGKGVIPLGTLTKRDTTPATTTTTTTHQPLTFKPDLHHNNSNKENASHQNEDINEPLLSTNMTSDSSAHHYSPHQVDSVPTLRYQTNTHAWIEANRAPSQPPLSFTQGKKQSWLHLLNLGYTLHSRLNLYEQYKLYLQIHQPEKCESILRHDKGPINCSHQDVISQSTFLRLLRRMRPDLTQQQSILLFEALDQHHHHHIHINEWFSFADFIDVQFISSNYRTAKQQLAIAPANIPSHLPRIFHYIGKFLTHWLTSCALDVITTIHFVILLIQLEASSKDSIWTKIMDIFNLVVLGLYSVEYFFKVLIFGPKRMYKSLLCSAEIILLVTAYVLYIFYFFSNRDSIFNPNSDIPFIRWLHSFFDQPTLTSLALTSTDILAFRVVRLYRHLYRFPRFRAILNTLKRLYPALRSLAVILVSEYYFFGLLGVCLFKGVIKKGQMNEEFMATYWAQNNYWENNFEDLYHAYITLFEIMIINNWNLNIEGWTVALNSHWPRIFFVCHFFLAIVIILNCVIALVLDAFISKYSSNEDHDREQRAKQTQERSHDGKKPDTLKQHMRETQRRQQIEQFNSQRDLISASQPFNTRNDVESNDQSNGALDEGWEHVQDDEEYEPYEMDESSDSDDDEVQQLVLTLIKRADHHNTIENDEMNDLHASGVRARSHTLQRSSTNTGTTTNPQNPDASAEQQRIVFKRRTQRMYQMIFDSGKS